MLATCGLAKNQQSSLSGCYSCPCLADGSSWLTPSRLKAFLRCPVQHARSFPSYLCTIPHGMACLLRRIYCCQMGRSTTRGLFPLAYTSLIAVKLWEVAWDLWDHRNQVKKYVEMAQDLALCNVILLAVRARNMPSAILVSHNRTGASSSALFSQHSQAPCTTWTPGYSGSERHAPEKSDERQTLSTLLSTPQKTTCQA